MRHELPNRPHLDHLKKQAKDLLDAHRKKQSAAFARIRESLPAFAGATDERIAAGPFGLHDAQSVIAREYGFRSFAELSAHVAERSRETLTEALIKKLTSLPLPESVLHAVRDVASQQADDPSVFEPERELPLLAVRNALVTPEMTAPIHVGRQSTLAAVRAAEATPARLVAVFAQRDPDVLVASASDLHDVGCVARVARTLPSEAGQLWVVLRGIAWVRLEALRNAGEHLAVRISALEVPDAAAEISPRIAALAAQLRDEAKAFARTFLPGTGAETLLDRIDEPRRLADAVMSNLPCTVEEKARFAAETELEVRLELALAALRGQAAVTR